MNVEDMIRDVLNVQPPGRYGDRLVMSIEYNPTRDTENPWTVNVGCEYAGPLNGYSGATLAEAIGNAQHAD